MARTEEVGQLAKLIWDTAELLRGDYKQAEAKLYYHLPSYGVWTVF